MIQAVRLLTIILFCVALFSRPAQAWTEPGIGLAGAFSTLKTRDSAGTEIKLSSSSWIRVTPELIWHLNNEGNAWVFRGSFQKVSFEPPGGVALSPSTFSLWGGSVLHRFPIQALSLSLGLEASQLVLVNVSSAVTAIPKISNYFGIPLEASYKLVVLQRQVLRVGLGTMVAVPVSSDVTSGYRLSPSLGYELRGELRSQIHFFFDLQHLGTSTGSRDETAIGVLLKLSLPGRKGLVPSPDERV